MDAKEDGSLKFLALLVNPADLGEAVPAASNDKPTLEFLMWQETKSNSTMHMVISYYGQLNSLDTSDLTYYTTIPVHFSDIY